MKFFTLYNQGLEYFTRNFCAGYTFFHILQIQWGIRRNNAFIIETAKEAERDKAFGQTRGAYYNILYKWFTDKILEIYGVEMKVRVIHGNSNDLETLLKKGYAFGIGLKYAGLFWRRGRKDGVITMEEVQANSSLYKEYGHSLTYFYSKVTNKYYILDSLKQSRKPIEMDIAVFREAIKNGIFYGNTRTLVLKDQKLHQYFQFFRDGGQLNTDVLSEADRKRVDKVLQIRTQFRFK